MTTTTTTTAIIITSTIGFSTLVDGWMPMQSRGTERSRDLKRCFETLKQGLLFVGESEPCMYVYNCIYVLYIIWYVYIYIIISYDIYYYIYIYKYIYIYIYYTWCVYIHLYVVAAGMFVPFIAYCRKDWIRCSKQKPSKKSEEHVTCVLQAKTRLEWCLSESFCIKSSEADLLLACFLWNQFWSSMKEPVWSNLGGKVRKHLSFHTKSKVFVFHWLD